MLVYYFIVLTYCGHVVVSSWLCLWTTTYPVSLVKIDITISPFRFVSIKSIPHCAVGVLLFRCCCCYSCCFCHPYSVLFFEMCDYFCSIFDSSISSFCCRRLSLLLMVVRYVFVAYNFCLVATLGDRSYVVLRLFWLILLDHWYHTYQCCCSL